MLGEIFVRRTGAVINGKEAYIISGIVSLNEVEKAQLKSEHQYIIKGADIHPGFERDLTDFARGKSIDGILTSPIWKL